MKDASEVALFSKLLDGFVTEEAQLPFHSINLPLWFDKCKGMKLGGKLFAALLDMKITVAFLFLDFHETLPDYKSLNSDDYLSILSSPLVFGQKMKLLHDHINLGIRLRTFYNKFMGLLVLMYLPKEYDSFLCAPKRKKAFKEKMKNLIEPETLDVLFKTISQLDEGFRTAEVHQAGRMRKWVLGGRDCYLDDAIKLRVYFNDILYLANWLDVLIGVDFENQE